MSKKNLEPIRKDPEKEAQEFESSSDEETIKAQKIDRERVGFRIPKQLKSNLYEESNRTGRSVTDIVVQQLSKRYD